MTRGPLADGGSLQTARISGRPCEYGGGGETTAKFPLRNFFGWPGFTIELLATAGVDPIVFLGQNQILLMFRRYPERTHRSRFYRVRREVPG